MIPVPSPGKTGTEGVCTEGTGPRTGSMRAMCCLQGTERCGTTRPPRALGPNPMPGTHSPLLSFPCANLVPASSSGPYIDPGSSGEGRRERASCHLPQPSHFKNKLIPTGTGSHRGHTAKTGFTPGSSDFPQHQLCKTLNSVVTMLVPAEMT